MPSQIDINKKHTAITILRETMWKLDQLAAEQGCSRNDVLDSYLLKCTAGIKLTPQNIKKMKEEQARDAEVRKAYSKQLYLRIKAREQEAEAGAEKGGNKDKRKKKNG